VHTAGLKLGFPEMQPADQLGFSFGICWELWVAALAATFRSRKLGLQPL